MDNCSNRYRGSNYRQKNYYEANKDKILEYHQNYYEVNKDRINKKVNCDCGCEVSRTNLLRHQKSKRHLNNMNNI